MNTSRLVSREFTPSATWSRERRNWPMLRRMQGMVAVGKMAGKPVTPINRNRIPGATYTEPGIGSVGLTEAQAKAAGYKVKVGKFPFAANSKATILGSHDGFVKVVADEKYGEILGVHIIGPQAYELISEAVAAMEAEARWRR